MAYVSEVAIAYASEAIAGHKRIHERETVVSDRLHYLCCAGDQAASFVPGSCLSAFGNAGLLKVSLSSGIRRDLRVLWLTVTLAPGRSDCALHLAATIKRFRAFHLAL
jgi:hypothetical protein